MINLINSVKELAIIAGRIALTKKSEGLEIYKKRDYSIVTNADLEISELIFITLSKLTPLIPIVCEERPLPKLVKDSFWLIDPIDGTRGYTKNKQSYTVNICLIERAIPKLGFIYQPELDTLYYTDADENLIVEQNKIRLNYSSYGSKANKIAAISSHDANIMTKNFLQANKLNEVIAIASSIKFCLVAEGKADIYPRFDQIMEWDVGAGHALIKAAGGEVFDIDKKPLIYGKAGFKHPFFIAVNKKQIINDIII